MSENREKKKIFISYAREDTEVAEKLYNDLKITGFEPWMDEEDLLPGQHWEMTVTNTIRESSYFLALLSESSVSKRGFVQQELKIALKLLERSSPKDIFIIPLRLDNCRPTDERLQILHRVDLFCSYEKGLKKILRVLEKPDQVSNAQKPEEEKQPVALKEQPVASEQEPKPDNKPEPSSQIRPSRKKMPELKIGWKPFIILSLLLICLLWPKTSIVKATTEDSKIPIPKIKNDSVSGNVYRLRSKPRVLSKDEVKAMVKKHNFFDSGLNKSGNFKNDFTDNGDGTVTDKVTGLMWQKSGSDGGMGYSKAEACIDSLNSKKSGYDDWRLPTLEELASLLENKEVNGLYIDSVFDCKGLWYWTADKRAVYFNLGRVLWSHSGSNHHFVLAVRSQTI